MINSKKYLIVIYLFLSLQHTAYAEKSCSLIARGPTLDSVKKKNIGQFSQRILVDLQQGNWKKFYQYFHPRARVKKSIGERTKAILDRRYKKPVEFSIYGLWKFTDSEKTRDLYSCERAENMKLISHYGYETQYMIVIQLLSKSELGRLVFSIAELKGKLFVVGFHIQQWSQEGRNWQQWTEKGNELLEKKDIRSSYIYFDIAQKLLDGGTLISYDYRKEVVSARDRLFTQEELVPTIQADSLEPRVVYVGTVIRPDATGMFVRIALEKEYNSEDMQEICTSIGRSLLSKNWLTHVSGGINCSFIPEGYDPTKNSKLGGYYIDRQTIESPPKKNG